MPAGYYAFTIDTGATFDRTITWKDKTGNLVDLTNWTAHLRIQEGPFATSSLLDLTTSNGGVVLGGSLGTIRLIATPTQTNTLTKSKLTYTLDLTRVSDGYVKPLLAGPIKISSRGVG